MTRQLRLAYLTSSLKLAGGERQMVELAARMPRDRIRVDFLCRTGEGPLDHVARATGTRVIYLGRASSSRDSSLGRMAAQVSRNWRYVTEARRGRYDIVDAWLYPSDMLAALTRPLTRVPIVLSGRINTQKHDRFGPLGRAVDAAAGRLTDAVVAISPTVAQFAIQSHKVAPEKIRVIRNGVVIPERPPPEETRYWRERLGASPGSLLVGCVGNYRDMKRQILLVDAFSNLVPQRPELRLALVGEGPMRAAIESRISELGIDDRVCVFGAVPDARPLYWAFDIVVQASISEGVPNVLLEAAAAKRAIVATAAGGSGEIVIDGETGLLVPVEDERSLTEAIRRVADDRSLGLRLGTNARHHATKVYGMGRFVHEWLTLYEELAAAKGLLH